jgi:hypothetical protein
MIRITVGMFKGCKGQKLPNHSKRLGGKDVPSVGIRLLEMPKHKDSCTSHYKVGDMIWLCDWQFENLPECKAPVIILDRLERAVTLQQFSSETDALEFITPEIVKAGYTFECATTKKGATALRVATLKQKWKEKLSKCK